MNIRLIKSETSSGSLLFLFLGWGIPPELFSSLRLEGWEIALAWGYGDKEKDGVQYRDFISSYRRVAVVAWSYGVAVADSLLSGNEEIAIAVNGTPFPVDIRRGIPPRIFNLTLRSVSPGNMLKFYDFVGIRNKFETSHNPSEIQKLKEELTFLGEIRNSAVSPFWTRAIVADDDRIIPPANQLFCWQEAGVPVSVIRGGTHLPDFNGIFAGHIVDKEIVGGKFSRALESYNSEAAVQLEVARNLYSLWRETVPVPDSPVLEIGCGSGFLTRQYCGEPFADDAVAVDLAPHETVMKSFASHEIEFRGNILSADAEEFVADTSMRFGSVLSSSTIQWFNNLPRFFRNLSRILLPGGSAAISMFVEGTFANLPHRSLNYISAGNLETLVGDSMTVIAFRVMDHKLRFPSASALFSHIRATGVNATSRNPLPAGTLRNLMRDIDSDPTLNFSTAYMILRK